jgi:hypothetical protein
MSYTVTDVIASYTLFGYRFELSKVQSVHDDIDEAIDAVHEKALQERLER